MKDSISPFHRVSFLKGILLGTCFGIKGAWYFGGSEDLHACIIYYSVIPFEKHAQLSEDLYCVVDNKQFKTNQDHLNETAPICVTEHGNTRQMAE